jgi:hypothetical protein
MVALIHFVRLSLGAHAHLARSVRLAMCLLLSLQGPGLCISLVGEPQGPCESRTETEEGDPVLLTSGLRRGLKQHSGYRISSGACIIESLCRRHLSSTCGASSIDNEAWSCPMRC